MSNSEETVKKVNKFIAGALKLIQVGVPVAREAFIIIEIAQSFAKRLAVGDIPTDAEVDAAILSRQSSLNDLLDTE